jgi:transcriptional regulator with XRE-family HTH domain
MLTHDQLLKRLMSLVAGYDSQLEAAEHLGVSPQYLSDVLRRKSEPGPAILEAMGYYKLVMYKEIKP